MKDDVTEIHELLDKLILLTTGRNAIEASWSASEKVIIICFTLEPKKKSNQKME